MPSGRACVHQVLQTAGAGQQRVGRRGRRDGPGGSDVARCHRQGRLPAAGPGLQHARERRRGRTHERRVRRRACRSAARQPDRRGAAVLAAGY